MGGVNRLMRCELCDEESNVIYASRTGLICSECYRKLKNSSEEKLRRRKELLDMYKKYGLIISEDEEILK